MQQTKWRDFQGPNAYIKEGDVMRSMEQIFSNVLLILYLGTNFGTPSHFDYYLSTTTNIPNINSLSNREPLDPSPLIRKQRNVEKPHFQSDGQGIVTRVDFKPG